MATEMTGIAADMIEERPTLEAILQHRWFHDGPFPPYVPVTAFDCVPSFEHLTTAQWRRNFESALQRSKFGAHATIATPASRRDDLGPSIIQQDKDFRYAVQPDSPVGALIQYVICIIVELHASSARLTQ
jgi:polo-like kinase 1